MLDLVTTIPEFWTSAKLGAPIEGEFANFPHYLTMNVVAMFACQYVLATFTAEFDEGVFDTIYADLEQYLYDYGSIPVTTTIELWNAHSIESPINLQKGVRLRHLSDEERESSRKAPVKLADSPRSCPYQCPT